MLSQSQLWFEIVSRNASEAQIRSFLHNCSRSEHFQTLGDLDQKSFLCLISLIEDSLDIRYPHDMLYSFLQHEITKYGFMKNEK